MKRWIGCVLTVITLIFCCGGCTDEEKHWWDDREHVVVKVTIEGAEPEFVEFRPGTQYSSYTPIERTFDGSVVEPKIQVFWNGQEVTEWGLELNEREKYDTYYQQWVLARGIQYPGEYKVHYSIYRGDPLNSKHFKSIGLRITINEKIN